MNLIRKQRHIVEVMNDNTGRVGGYQIYHWDGRVDAVVRPPHLRFKWNMQAFELHESGLAVPVR